MTRKNVRTSFYILGGASPWGFRSLLHDCLSFSLVDVESDGKVSDQRVRNTLTALPQAGESIVGGRFYRGSVFVVSGPRVGIRKGWGRIGGPPAVVRVTERGRKADAMFGVGGPIDLEAGSIRGRVSGLALLGKGQQRIVAGANSQGVGRVDGGWIEGRVR